MCVCLLARKQGPAWVRYFPRQGSWTTTTTRAKAAVTPTVTTAAATAAAAAAEGAAADGAAIRSTVKTNRKIVMMPLPTSCNPFSTSHLLLRSDSGSGSAIIGSTSTSTSGNKRGRQIQFQFATTAADDTNGTATETINNNNTDQSQREPGIINRGIILKAASPRSRNNKSIHLDEANLLLTFLKV